MGEADVRQCPNCYIFVVVNNYWLDSKCEDCGYILRPKFILEGETT